MSVVNTFLFADDQVVLVSSEDELYRAVGTSDLGLPNIKKLYM